MALTDAKCRAAQPEAKLQKLTDGGGLQLWVQPSGALSVNGHLAWAHTMPLKRMLDEGGSYDPRDVAILSEAFEGVVTELGLRALSERESAAKLIMEVAVKQTPLNASKLRDCVPNLMPN
jgi:hypothetical protein